VFPAADEPADPIDADSADSDLGREAPLAKVIPFGVFEAGDERRYR
jgi:hypothetical protein